ncbi:hypothetical protein Syun_012857 [Stephania yunnanensis]|uniref:Uncharacterized protein n=1 Tax=Stephania yunnanensis TaxID=152371 RepID=A0AAP0K089_9MAGN
MTPIPRFFPINRFPGDARAARSSLRRSCCFPGEKARRGAHLLVRVSDLGRISVGWIYWLCHDLGLAATMVREAWTEVVRKGKQKDKHEGPNFKGISPGSQASSSANGGLVSETHRGTAAAEGGHPTRPLQRGNNVTACDWEPTLVIFRSSRYDAWEEIEERLTLALNRPTSLKSIGEDRAILFCSSDAERMRIIHRLESIGGDLVASVT